MGWTTEMKNRALDRFVSTEIADNGNMRIALWNNGSAVTAGGLGQIVIDGGWAAASSGSKEATDFEAFTPSGAAATYDEIRIYANNGTTLLASETTQDLFALSEITIPDANTENLKPRLRLQDVA